MKERTTFLILDQVRTANRHSERGREEGVHCKGILNPEIKHICDAEKSAQVSPCITLINYF